MPFRRSNSQRRTALLRNRMRNRKTELEPKVDASVGTRAGRKFLEESEEEDSGKKSLR